MPEGISKAEWTHDRARQEEEWDQLVDKIFENPAGMDRLFGKIRDGLADPLTTVHRLKRPELGILFLLAHLAAGEGLLRAVDPGGPNRG